jgi:membrane-bound lytic murein transglycosylase B
MGMRTALAVLALSVSAAAQTLEQAGSFSLTAALAAQRAILRASLPAAEARRLVKAKLAGSGVPEAYVDSVFDDPRSRLYPDIPPKFGTPTTPVPPLPYDQYRRKFVTPENLDAGVKFIRDHRSLLAAVEARYGVDGTLLVGLVCVETRYGTAAGRYSVFDALNTIIQGVPRRSDWAAREAAAYLKMTFAGGLDAHGTLGSYAGAFGFVQFMPTSWERVAVDFDGDDSRRLDQWPDALASAANYLARAGYKAADPFIPSSSIGRSLHAYNHSDNYVQVILDLREELLKRSP